MPITKCSEINTQVYEEADEEALPLAASSIADYSDPNDPWSTFCFNDRGETEWIGNDLGASEHYQWKIFIMKI